MFAVVKTGGKQYSVSPGKLVRIERIIGEVGEQVLLGDVLMVADGEGSKVGAPLVDGASISCEIVSQGRDKKIDVFKKKRRNNYRRKKGHKQLNTIVMIEEILLDGKKPSAKKATNEAAKKEKAADKNADEAKVVAQDEKKGGPNKVAKKEAKTTEANPVEAKKETKPAEAKTEFKLLDKPKGEIDDLKKISGVGPVLEKKLHDLGIYHYWQIAEFSKEDIDKVDGVLNFKGRIEREDWVSQAKELMK